MKKKLETLQTFEVLNEQELLITSGGGFTVAASGSDKTDVDTTSGDSWSDDNSKSTDSYTRDKESLSPAFS